MRASYGGQDVQVTFTGDGHPVDFGVPRSPVWYEVDNVQIETLEICGVAVDPSSLPADLREAIRELHLDLEWE